MDAAVLRSLNTFFLYIIKPPNNSRTIRRYVLITTIITYYYNYLYKVSSYLINYIDKMDLMTLRLKTSIYQTLS